MATDTHLVIPDSSTRQFEKQSDVNTKYGIQTDGSKYDCSNVEDQQVREINLKPNLK